MSFAFSLSRRRGCDLRAQVICSVLQTMCDKYHDCPDQCTPGFPCSIDQLDLDVRVLLGRVVFYFPPSVFAHDGCTHFFPHGAVLAVPMSMDYDAQ